MYRGLGVVGIGSLYSLAVVVEGFKCCSHIVTMQGFIRTDPKP